MSRHPEGHMALVTSTSVVTSEEHLQVTSDESGGVKRRGSWKKFKESVKETVQGWVGTKSVSEAEANAATVPSAVFPTDEVTSATCDVQEVLHHTNCYSGVKRSSMPNAQQQQPLPHPAAQQPGAEVPTIVVTCDERQAASIPPERPARHKGPSKQAPAHVPQQQQLPNAAAAVSAEEQSRQQRSMPIPTVIQTPPSPENRTRISQEERASSSPQRPASPPVAVPTSLSNTTRSTPEKGAPPAAAPSDEADLKKRMAVLKIKQAILNMNEDQAASLGLVPRRNSDTANIPCSSSAAPADPLCSPVVGSLPPGLRPQQIQQRRKSNSEVIGLQASGGPSGGSGGAPRVNVQRSHSMKKPKPKPMIWEHFDELPHTSTQGRCRACKMNVSCKFNTGNFVRHLQLAHKDIYRQYQNKMESQWTRSVLERSLK